MGIDSADDWRPSTSETVAGTVPRLAERRIRSTVRLPGEMDGQAADDLVAAPRATSRLRRVPRGSMATAVRRLRHQRRLDALRDSASVSRFAAGAIHARAARHAMVSEQADCPPIDANCVAAGCPQAKKDHNSSEPGFQARSRGRIAPPGAITGSVALCEPRQDDVHAEELPRVARRAAAAWLELLASESRQCLLNGDLR